MSYADTVTRVNRTAMNRLGFDCTSCRHRLAVKADRAGKAVRCPKCQAVMLAPAGTEPVSGSTPVSPPDLRGVARRVDDADSIFSDPADGDGESLFDDGATPRKPLFPSPLDSSQATLRVPGVPGPPRSPVSFTPQPVPESQSGSRAAIDLFVAAAVPAAVPAPVVSPAEATNPFRRMVDEVMNEGREQDAADADRHDEDELFPDTRLAGGSAWKTWALVAVSVYALLATAVAVWGWSRTPSDKPAAVKKPG